jgi:4-hydroxyproline epimerase
MKGCAGIDSMIAREYQRIRVIDSHTGGEPTRLVVSGGPDLGSDSLSDRLLRFRDQHDSFRSAVVNEPRGSDVMVGALLCKPTDSACVAGVIFFNNVGYLGMCGHGTIGLVATLAHMGRIGPGRHVIETPVGKVGAILHESGEVTVSNVESYRSSANLVLEVPGYGRVRGDVAWGGNWFFLAEMQNVEMLSGSGRQHSLDLILENVEELTAFTWAIRQALRQNGVSGAGGQEIDHVEIFASSHVPSVDSRNFVLCPGKAYDRSPCGTGTSAKLACLHADGKISEGQTWRQESIIGSVFEGSIEIRESKVYPQIRGSAFVNAEAELLLDSRDPLSMGIRS